MVVDVASGPRRGLDELAEQLERAMDRLTRRSFSHFRANECWSPAINAYRLDDRIEVCVDLAGVDRQEIGVLAEPGLLILRGSRHGPQPDAPPDANVQILTMEIDHGPFERRIVLPRQVDVHQISAEQRNGLLWIRLPMKKRRAHGDPGV